MLGVLLVLMCGRCVFCGLVTELRGDFRLVSLVPGVVGRWGFHRGLIAWWVCIFGPGNRSEALRCFCSVTHDTTHIYHVYY